MNQRKPGHLVPPFVSPIIFLHFYPIVCPLTQTKALHRWLISEQPKLITLLAVQYIYRLLPLPSHFDWRFIFTPQLMLLPVVGIFSLSFSPRFYCCRRLCWDNTHTQTKMGRHSWRQSTCLMCATVWLQLRLNAVQRHSKTVCLGDKLQQQHILMRCTSMLLLLPTVSQRPDSI